MPEIIFGISLLNICYIYFLFEIMKRFLLLLTFLLFITCDVLPPDRPVYRPGSSNSTSSNAANNERSEFAALMEKDKINKKHVNAEVLTYLLNDTDPAESHTAAVIENTSGCDIIVRMVGISNNQIYNLPISAHTKNQFVVQKGNYTVKSNICGGNYYSQKYLTDPLILKLSAK